MYAPGTGRKWCLMNVLMYLWLFVLGLCVLLCGQGAGVLAMHQQTRPPSRAVSPSYFLVPAASPRSWRREGSPVFVATAALAESVTDSLISSSLPTEAPDNAALHHLYSRSSSSSSSNLNASDLDKQPHSQLENIWYRIWRRRRHIESLRRKRSRWLQQQILNPADSIEVHDSRPKLDLASARRSKRDSRFDRYPTRMFQHSQTSPSSVGSQGPIHLHPKFYPPSPSMPSAVASPSLTSARQRLGFEQQQHTNRHAAGTSESGGSVTSHNAMLLKPKDQHGVPEVVPTLHSDSVMGTTTTSNAHEGTGALKGLLPMKGRKYCSARDPANLAFEAGVVFEGRVRSISTHNYSVTFQVLKMHKMQPGFPQVPSHIRIHFKHVKNLDCDLHPENFRNPAHIRGRLDQGRVYFIFGKFVDLNNFTLIGQPMRSSEKHQREVRNGLSETYGQSSSIEKLLVKGRPSRPVKLICKVNGRPPPTVTWYKGSQLITRNRNKYKLVHRKRQSQLIIRTYNASDSGLYVCSARNRLSKQSANETISVDFAHYLKPGTPTRTSHPSPESRPSSGGSVTDEEEPPIGAEECPPEQKERYCMNGGKCVYFSSVREFSCRCADGFGGERCDMKTPTTYNHSSMYSTHCEHNTYLGSYYC